MAALLADRRCVPCNGGTRALGEGEIRDLLGELPGWAVDGGRIVRTYEFGDFKEAVAFVNRVTPIAEAEGHHPDLEIGWGRARVMLTTHAIDGLSENDFILAAKIDRGECLAHNG